MTHALLLLLSLACASDPTAAAPDAEATGDAVHIFARLTPAEAARLEGKRARYHVAVEEVIDVDKAGVAHAIRAPGDGTGPTFS